LNPWNLRNLWILLAAGAAAVWAVAAGATIVSAQAAASAAAPPAVPDFSRDVMPIFESNCLRCHNSAEQKGGLLLESYDDLMRGGDDGVPVVAGNADESPMIRQVEGHAKPKMPPKADLRPEDVAVLRAWIAAGAKYSPPRRVSLDDKVPALAQSGGLMAEVPALGFSPDGGELAIAGYKEVRRFRVPSGAGDPAIGGLSDQVRALAWSPDGKLLAAGGGTPGAFGELVLIDATTGAVVRTLDGHRDYVYSVAFSPDGKRLASCGYDRQIRIWDTATGKPVGVLKEHTEAVYAVAFDPTGKLLASASADRSVKIWDAAKGVRLYTINDPTDAVLTLAFRPGTNVLVAGGADKRLRAWTIDASAAKLVANTLAHTAGIIKLAFSPDGKRLASASSNREVKLWSADLKEERALPSQSDWVQSLAFSPDGKELALGRYDGTVSLFDPATGRRVQDLIRPAAQADARRGE
jgi:WD40 repeat protein